MTNEVKLNFYSEKLGVGFNDYRQIFCNKTNTWMDACYHLGRLVYGKKRLPYKKIVKSISHRDYIAQEFIPF